MLNCHILSDPQVNREPHRANRQSLDELRDLRRAVISHGRLEPAGKLPGGSTGALHLSWQGTSHTHTHSRMYTLRRTHSVPASAAPVRLPAHIAGRR